MGFLGGLMDSFTGKGARKDLDKGIGAVQENTGKSVDAYKQYGDQAQGYVKPFVEGGQQLYGMYKNALSGDPSAINSAYFGNDALQQSRRLDLMRTQRGANAGGNYSGPDGSRSGAGALADSRVNQEYYYRNLDRYRDAGAAGQAAGQFAGSLAAGTGAGVAGAYGANSGQLASLYGQRAQTENALAQNVIGLGSLAVSAYTGMPMPRMGGGNNLGQQPMSQAAFDRMYGQAQQSPQYNPQSGGYDPR